ncbi:MAG: hypothetical protein ABEJ36_04065 [Candidatus Nanosalina sp.]
MTDGEVDEDRRILGWAVLGGIISTVTGYGSIKAYEAATGHNVGWNDLEDLLDGSRKGRDTPDNYTTTRTPDGEPPTTDTPTPTTTGPSTTSPPGTTEPPETYDGEEPPSGDGTIDTPVPTPAEPEPYIESLDIWTSGDTTYDLNEDFDLEAEAVGEGVTNLELYWKRQGNIGWNFLKGKEWDEFYSEDKDLINYSIEKDDLDMREGTWEFAVVASSDGEELGTKTTAVEVKDYY